MRIVVALGGNALLKRGEPMTHDVQRANIQVAARAMAPVAKGTSKGSRLPSSCSIM
jgi:carbamate kinase